MKKHCTLNNLFNQIRGGEETASISKKKKYLFLYTLVFGQTVSKKKKAASEYWKKQFLFYYGMERKN